MCDHEFISDMKTSEMGLCPKHSPVIMMVLQSQFGFEKGLTYIIIHCSAQTETETQTCMADVSSARKKRNINK